MRRHPDRTRRCVRTITCLFSISSFALSLHKLLTRLGHNAWHVQNAQSGSSKLEPPHRPICSLAFGFGVETFCTSLSLVKLQPKVPSEPEASASPGRVPADKSAVAKELAALREAPEVTRAAPPELGRKLKAPGSIERKTMKLIKQLANPVIGVSAVETALTPTASSTASGKALTPTVASHAKTATAKVMPSDGEKAKTTEKPKSHGTPGKSSSKGNLISKPKPASPAVEKLKTTASNGNSRERTDSPQSDEGLVPESFMQSILQQHSATTAGAATPGSLEGAMTGSAFGSPGMHPMWSMYPTFQGMPLMDPAVMAASLGYNIQGMQRAATPPKKAADVSKKQPTPAKKSGSQQATGKKVTQQGAPKGTGHQARTGASWHQTGPRPTGSQPGPTGTWHQVGPRPAGQQQQQQQQQQQRPTQKQNPAATLQGLKRSYSPGSASAPMFQPSIRLPKLEDQLKKKKKPNPASSSGAPPLMSVKPKASVAAKGSVPRAAAVSSAAPRPPQPGRAAPPPGAPRPVSLIRASDVRGPPRGGAAVAVPPAHAHTKKVTVYPVNMTPPGGRQPPPAHSRKPSTPLISHRPPGVGGVRPMPPMNRAPGAPVSRMPGAGIRASAPPRPRPPPSPESSSDSDVIVLSDSDSD